MMSLDLIKCKLGYHRKWNHYQEIFVTHTYHKDEHKVVIAFKVCALCAKSKLIHILV